VDSLFREPLIADVLPKTKESAMLHPVVASFIIAAAGLSLLPASSFAADGSADLVKVLSGSTNESERRLAALHLYDNHLDQLMWSDKPDLSPLQELVVSATSDHSPKVRERALDSLRRTLRDFTLHSSSDLSPEVVAARNANREANRKKAAAICAKQFLAAGRLKVLEQMSEDAANEDLAVQAKHVLLYLLQLEDGAVLKAAVDGKVQNEVFVWAKGAAGQN
jgi:hypothetical protein